MVDVERLARLLDRLTADIGQLKRHRPRGRELVNDRDALAAVKYHFITAIEGCARVAQHLIVSEGWRVAETNGDAVRRLGTEGVLTEATAKSVGAAVGFRNILIHEYIDVDEDQVADNLELLSDLDAFVSEVASWARERS